MIMLHGWVVTHCDDHDDHESLERAISAHASSAAKAWQRFLALVGGDRKTWNDRGYVARRVVIRVRFEKP